MITKLFPELNEVFENPQAEHQQYFFPICSVDLSQINPEWNETIHFMLFNDDPYNEERVPYFNKICSDNSLGFHVQNGKMTLATDMNFMKVSDNWEEWLHKTKSQYLEAKAKYNDPDNKINYPAKIKIGGEPQWVQGDDTPFDKNVMPLRYIGEFYTGSFVSDYCAKDVYVFYNPEEKTVVQVYQIT